MFTSETNQDKIELFCSELGSNDWNPLHNAEEFEKQNLAEKTGFKGAIVPGMYELLVCELALKERGYINPVLIDSKFKGEIYIDESIEVKEESGSSEIEKKIFNLSGYSIEREKACFESDFSYSCNTSEVVDKTKGMIVSEKQLVCEIGIDKNNLEMIFLSVGKENENWIPGMLYPSCLVSRVLLELNKNEERNAVYRNLRFLFHKRVEDIGFGKFGVYANNPNIKEIKRKDLNLLKKEYCLSSYSERNELCLSARVELIFY